MTTQQIDQAKVDAAGAKMRGVLNSAAIALMTSIGYQTGLFDTMATLPPSTSDEIAEAAGLNERYVREWLGAMVMGEIVSYEPEGKRYHLAPEYAAWLTRAAGLRNMGPHIQMVSMLANVEEQVVDCFRNGGGVPYSSFGTFQGIMAQSSATRFDALLIDRVIPSVPGAVAALQAGVDVADIGCGAGHAINLMAKAFPNSRFTGLDISESGIAAGKAESERLGLQNTHFEVRDVAKLELHDAFDLITAFDAIHDQARPAAVLRGIAEALRPNGSFLMVDIQASSNLEENATHPLSPFIYTVSTMHCMTVSLALDGAGLGTAWGEQLARRMLSDAGFASVDVARLPGDIVNNYYIAKKST